VSFPATARIDSRLTIVDWPLDPDHELASVVTALATFELANDAPAIVDDDTSRHLVWRAF
jgi:hypothetical protein